MYGQTGAASGVTGASALVYSVDTGSYVLAAVASLLIISAAVLLFVNHRRRKGARP